MNIDEINGVQDILSAATLLISIRKLADRNGNVETRKVGLCLLDLRGELVVRQHVVVQWFGTELNASCHELGLGIAVQRFE